MQKQYIYHNIANDRVCGFNANSPHQSRVKMTRLAKQYFLDLPNDWKLVETGKKLERLRWD